jgi:PGF-CTERM protein
MLKKVILSMLLVAMLMFTASAELSFDTNLEKTDESYTISIFDLAVYVVDIDASDPWNTYATPGQEITVDFVICNWDSASDEYFAQMYIIDSGGTGDMVWSTPSNVYIAPGECAPDYFFSFNAPTTPGTYKIEANSFKVSDWSLDDTSYFWLHVESSATPTSTPPPTSTPTASPTGTAPPANNPPNIKVDRTTAGYIYSFDASGSTDQDGTIVSYEWGIDGTAAGTGQTFELDASTFAAGTHQVKLVITDNDGDSSSYTFDLSVSVEDDVVVIESGDETTVEGDTDKEPSTGSKEDAIFVMRIGGQPYYIPGFSAVFAIAALLTATYLFYRKRED